MFRFAGDNCAPMKAESVIKGFESLKDKYPDTQIVPATLNDLALEAEKIGQMIDPFNRASSGGIQNYTTGNVENSHLRMSFDDAKINGEAISVNLYNNIWGTNFPMWYGEDGRIRIKINII